MGAALAVICASAAAEVQAVADLPEGARLELHDTAGPCKAPALFVEFIAANGERTGGCYMLKGSTVAMVFFDTDVGQVPVAALKPPKKV